MSLHELDKRVLILLIGQTYESMSIEELSTVKENMDSAYEKKRIDYNRNSILEKTKDWEHREFVLEHLNSLSLITKVQTYHDTDECDETYVEYIFIIRTAKEEIKAEVQEYDGGLYLSHDCENNVDRSFLLGLSLYSKKMNNRKRRDFMQKLTAMLNENY